MVKLENMKLGWEPLEQELETCNSKLRQYPKFQHNRVYGYSSVLLGHG